MSFYAMINDRAKANYSGPELTRENYEEVWFPAWFGAAQNIHDEFVAEGLTVTAAAVKVIIDENKKLSGYEGV